MMTAREQLRIANMRFWHFEDEVLKYPTTRYPESQVNMARKIAYELWIEAVIRFRTEQS